MRDHDLTARATQDIHELHQLLPHITHARNDYHLWGALGFGAGSNGRQGGHSDPTATTALNPTATRLHTQMALEYAGIENDLEQIHLATRRLARRVLLATTTRTSILGEPGCTNCAHTRDHDSKPLWTPIHETSRQLCRWCSDFRTQHGVLPAATLVAAHIRDGQRVTTAMLLAAHPELTRAKARA